MEKVKQSDFCEETYWVVDCPACGQSTEWYDDPAYEESIVCQHCEETIEIED